MDYLEKTIKMNMLLDFYSPLLTEKQFKYMELYYKDNYSLSEIASIYQISRNAIYDNLQRTIKQLEHYEKSLQLHHKFDKRKQIYDKIRNDYHDAKLHQMIDDLENLE